MRMRGNVSNPLDQARNPSGNLLEMSPFLYWKAETRRHSGTRRTVSTKIPEDHLSRGAKLIFKYFWHLVFTATSWALASGDEEILVGGQAVIEGVMMRSPRGYSVALRRQDGTIRVMKDALLTLG